MSTLTAPAAPVKTTRRRKDRTARVLCVLSPDDLLLEVEEAGKATLYHVEATPADFGRGFRWAKFAGDREVYAVNVGDGDHPASCECLGHLKHGHRTTCKHVACTRAIIARGRL
jgi:hypothetical protein